MKEEKEEISNPDLILIGAGIMSSTLGMMVKELYPGLTIQLFERLEMVAGESSDAWNNAGTGHSALCELNYTPERTDGTIDIHKAVEIAESFEVSKEFWAYLVQAGYITDPERFITSIPHMSFVWGEKNVEYLRKRYEALKEISLFKGMLYSEDAAQLKEWMPLVMEGRDPLEKVAATRMEIGTDVNFGALTRRLLLRLEETENYSLFLNHEVRDLKQDKDGFWTLTIKDLSTNKKRKVRSKFVFIGAGGGSLPLLEKSGIPESKGFGGFPVSGQWLKCVNEAIIDKHSAKVYGKASVGSPPMSVPHLDTRTIHKKRALLFGPYAGFSTKFLKNGSFMDLPLSIKTSNILPMLSAGLDNIPLTKYLIAQVSQSPADRLNALKEYYPDARMEDWELETAGQRVQVIKKDPELGGILEFGTEVVMSSDKTIAALLGASPGASTSVSIMLDLLERCLGLSSISAERREKLMEMIPSYGRSFAEDEELCQLTRKRTSKLLGLAGS